jgi:hypothetical protein
MRREDDRVLVDRVGGLDHAADRHADQRPDRQPGDHADQNQAHESTTR